MQRPTCLIATTLAFITTMGCEVRAESLNVRWNANSGDWTETAKWDHGVPDATSRASIHGAGEVTVPKGRTVVGELELGVGPGDRSTLRIDGGELVVRRGMIRVAEERDSQATLVLNEGALHCVSGVYLGGANMAPGDNCVGTLRIRGGSFLCRQLILAWRQNAEGRFEVEGSRASSVHVLDGLILGYAGTNIPATSTIAFTLDERGVTPITIQSRRQGVALENRSKENRCVLKIALNAVPPRGDVPLIVANRKTSGVFDGLPEGSEVAADFGGRTYRWTLTYKGGKSGCDLMLTSVRGHAADAPATACRPIPAPPVPLWRDLPLHEPWGDLAARMSGAVEGFGKAAKGGAGGTTIAVENLNDAGPGSLRAAVQSKGARIIVFRVGGEILLKTSLSIMNPFVTIDGASAPAPGITLRGHGMVVRANDVILRHFRIRPGDRASDDDALWFYDAERCLADHLSLSWGTDEVLSITGLSDSITVQWCIISEGLNFARHGYASILGGERVSWHHNLLAHHISRVPRFAGVVNADFRNNVLYDWGGTAGYGEFERCNYVNNYLKPGPSTTQRPPLFHNGDSEVDAGSLYLKGNVIKGYPDVARDNSRGVNFPRSVLAEQPFPVPFVRTEPAFAALESVLRGAGATRPGRDATDERIVREVQEGTGRVIDSVEQAGKPVPAK